MSLFFGRPCILGKDISYIKFRRKFEILQPLFHRNVPNEKYFNLTEAIEHVGYFETTTISAECRCKQQQRFQNGIRLPNCGAVGSSNLPTFLYDLEELFSTMAHAWYRGARRIFISVCDFKYSKSNININIEIYRNWRSTSRPKSKTNYSE